ncbi:MAG: hypothetical protein WD226_13240 [Planctomycetota bacterium]
MAGEFDPLDVEGLDLSPGALVAGLFVSTLGFALFLYGKKSLRMPQLVTGIALMGFPYFVQGATLTLAIGGVLLVGLWSIVRLGN